MNQLSESFKVHELGKIIWCKCNAYEFLLPYKNMSNKYVALLQYTGILGLIRN